jgi:protein-S-isoprenylcysteine O-methyltransferase Ste14
VYFAGMLAEIGVRWPYDRQRRRIPKTDQRVTPAERSILTVLLLAGFMLPLVFSFTPWLRFADYRLPPRLKARSGGAGALLLAAAVWVFWRAHRDLGANWSPSLEIGAGQTLVTRGVYGLIRHPMYTSHLIWGFAQALLLQNWIASPASLLTFPLFYYVRMPAEERLMLDHFGDAYRAYGAKTGRILPRLRR